MYDVDPVLCLLALACGDEIGFGVAEKQGWLTFNFENSIVYDLKTFDNPGRFLITHPAVFLRYQD